MLSFLLLLKETSFMMLSRRKRRLVLVCRVSSEVWSVLRLLSLRLRPRPRGIGVWQRRRRCGGAPESISEVGRFRAPIEDILSDDICRTIDSGYSWSEVLTFESGTSDCNCDVQV